MNNVASLEAALRVSVFLADKIACDRSAAPELRRKQALADFATFGAFKKANVDPAAWSALQKGLGWGVGLGVPAAGLGYFLTRNARNEGEELIREARNQALLTAAGVGGMQGLAGLLKRTPKFKSDVRHNVRHDVNINAPTQANAAAYSDQLAGLPALPPLTPLQKIGAAIMVDDVLEDACDQIDDRRAKHAALVELIKHRVEATGLLRELIL